MELLADVKPAAKMPAWPIRWIVGAAVAAHFATVLLACTSTETPNFPASPLALAASEHVRPYMKATLFDNAYRFFAPNPTTPLLFWIRIENTDGAIRWVELLGEPDSKYVRTSHQRRVNLGAQFGSQLFLEKDPEGRARFTPLGEEWLASLVRHVRHKHAAEVASFTMYALQHAIVSPQQARDGWTPTDLRTYRIMPVGDFDADGKRVAAKEPVAEQSTAQVVTRMLWTDVRPRLKKETREAVMDSLSLPGPVTRFLKGRPELFDLEVEAGEVTAYIDSLLAGAP